MNTPTATAPSPGAALASRTIPRRSTSRRGDARPKVAYIVSRFPTLTETFVLSEILAVEEAGVGVEIYPLRGRRAASSGSGASFLRKVLDLFRRARGEKPMHAEATPLVRRAHYHPLVSWSVLLANVRLLACHPLLYLSALWALVRGTWGSPKLCAGGLALFPKAVWLSGRLRREGIRHVHAHFATHPAAAAFLVHRLAGIGYSFTAHGSDIHVDRHMLREKVRAADRVFAISLYNRRVIADACAPDSASRVEVVHCGVDTSLFRFESRQRGCEAEAVSRPPRGGPKKGSDPLRAGGAETSRDYQKGSDPFFGQPLRLLCIGTLYEVKGQRWLIEACRLLRDQGVAFECRLVGEGPDRAALESQIAAAGLGERVHLLGARLRDEVAALLRESDALIAPSVPTAEGRREGIPVVLMEAMASGVPVVASRLSGIPELVVDGETGLLAPSRDAQALAASIRRLREEPGLAERLRVAARAKVEAEFDVKHNAAVLADYFAGRCIDALPAPAAETAAHSQPMDSELQPWGQVS